nr:response regulator transcription factor [uncultured Flavobacterium sp.]
MKVLIIEDDPTLSQNIKDALLEEEIFSDTVFDGVLAERLLKNQLYDAVILDVNLPGKTGYEICKSFREFNTNTPVIMLTAFSELDDKIEGFNAGADDYLTKPFFMKELSTRIKLLIKKTQNFKYGNTEVTSYTFSDISVNTISKTANRLGVEIELTPREYQILVKLMIAQGELVTKAELIETIWGKAIDANTNTIEVYINFLRKKIDKAFQKNTIKTKIGFGYYLSK